MLIGNIFSLFTIFTPFSNLLNIKKDTTTPPAKAKAKSNGTSASLVDGAGGEGFDLPYRRRY